MRFHLVQTELVWEDARANRERFSEKLSGVSGGLVVLPEMFSTGFSMASAHLAEPMDGPTVSWMRDLSGELDAILCGSVIISAGDHYYNRFLWTRPGEEPLCYDKRHLFRMAAEDRYYSAGQTRLVVNSHGVNICPQVCYDLRFPVWSRNDGTIDVLLYVANWPAARREHWLALLKARAIENLCYVIGVNRIGTDGNDIDYTGDSCVIDFRGETLLDMGNTDAIESWDIDLEALEAYRESFPAFLDADRFEITPQQP